MDRREFLLAMIATSLSAQFVRASDVNNKTSDALGELLPQRMLGRTGEMVTVLGLGGYHIGKPTELIAQATIEKSLEEGVRFFDTAESYQSGTSEKRYGKFLTPKYRDQVYLMTKSTAKDAKTAREHLEGSLKRLRTDQLDLWQVHSLMSPSDVDSRIANGVLDVAIQAKAEGKVRHIGFTGHASPAAHRRMLERAGNSFATCQMPINPVDAGAEASFIGSALPRLVEQQYGILAMKTLAGGRFFARKNTKGHGAGEDDDLVIPDQLSVADCIQFTLSLPISVLITGAETPELLTEKADLVRGFQKLSASQRTALIEKVSKHAAAGKVEFYKTKD
jgi:aryl-alcohol dehydrogenase-like predicted oxidoreductase